MSRKRVRLLTYNVFLRPPPIKTNLDDYKEERFIQIMKIIQDYDVVCFQEMFQMGTFRTERIIEEAIKQSNSPFMQNSTIGRPANPLLSSPDPW
jgi:hypothetical protein